MIRFLVLFITLAALAHAQISAFVIISGVACPWLAGQPVGVTALASASPSESPVPVPLAICAGALFEFGGVSGLASNVPGGGIYPADGAPNQSVTAGPVLGLGGITAPLCALLGVFLPDGPNPGTAPPAMDFSTPASRDFPLLAPSLHSVFFIGNGLRNDNLTPQQFQAPAGARRLFLGVMDTTQWGYNSGSFNTTAVRIFGNCAQVVTAGSGCGATQPQLAMSVPVLGTQVAITLAWAPPASGGLFVFGFPAIPQLPLGSGCDLYVDPAGWFLLPLATGALGVWSLGFGLPPDPVLAGVSVALQVAVADPVASLGFDVSNALIATLGF